MKREDTKDPLAMQLLTQDLFRRLDYAKEQLLHVDLAPGRANQIHYKATLQWLKTMEELLTFED